MNFKTPETGNIFHFKQFFSGWDGYNINSVLDKDIQRALINKDNTLSKI